MNPDYSGWSSSATTSNYPSPGRREHAAQPLSLMTALNAAQFQHASTPLSSTSLSSPFTHGVSPAVASPHNARSASSSSMAARQFSMPYNPQDWGPVGGHSSQPGYAQQPTLHHAAQQQRVQTESSLSPPPPPYSPPHNHSSGHGESYAHASPSAPAVSHATVTPPHQSHATAGYDHAADFNQRPAPRPRPISMVYGNDVDIHRQSLPPPPPPPGSRSMSQSRISTYQGSPYNAPSSSQPRAISVSYEQTHSSPAPQNHGLGLTPAQLESPSRPPASRRAASAGAVVSNTSYPRPPNLSRGTSPASSWGPGMPLPPPPPGPPPVAGSASVSGSSESSSARTVQGAGRNRARPPPLMGTGLGSIPPTPADWVDEEYMNHRPTSDREPLHIDTVKAMKAADTGDLLDSNGQIQQSQRTPGSGGSGLFRSAAIRDPSAKGIRERRIERRNRQSQHFEDMSAVSATSPTPWADALDQLVPSNLVLPEAKNQPEHSRQPSTSRFTPRSTRSIGSDSQPAPSRSRASSGGLFSDRSSSYSSPKPDSGTAGQATSFAPTPPFSPGGGPSSRNSQREAQLVPPKALPTPPLNSGKEPQSRSRAASRGPEDRPISHLLHLPNDRIPGIAPLSPNRFSVQQEAPGASPESIIKQDAEFVQSTIQRHLKFIEEEAAAVDEADALRIFNNFIIAESQIRRQRYAAVFDAASAQVTEVRSKLFEMPTATIQPDALSTKPAKPTPTLEIPSNRPIRPESAWWNNYQPCLSPIASLGMSNDEMSSRGRAPSRWWESKTGSSSDGVARRIQRSKRESKYMGLAKDSLQWDQERTPSRLDDTEANYSGQQVPYGPDEYPPEKSGWSDETGGFPGPGRNERAQYTTSYKLDISRLVTLPPPYPRHYPAVNNSHPDLVSYRTIVRSITDLTEIKATRERYTSDVERMIQEHQSQVAEGRSQFKANIQNQIQEGSISFAEAAEAEAAMLSDQNQRERDLAKRQLDIYQDTVLNPMNGIITDRISRATNCIDELSNRLFDDAQRETPDQTQEEGDENPELLEKLTQLKWLFEAREQLHREAFELVRARDEKYKSVAILPYQQGKNEEKIRETLAFFAKDAMDRRIQYETSALGRLESFLDVIEQNVIRGVEIQLSAFWDIAPSLLALVQQVPENLRGFQVQIPAEEYIENPSYHKHPLQYLYSLLSHAERSSYQYIESQTNLLCLLHEVRSAVMRASRNLAEAELIWQGKPEDAVREQMQLARADEEVTLTADLKEKVATVEGQWTEALGSQIQGLRERVKNQLLAEDAWEDLEQLEQE
ncbi:hypothetical protein N7539_006144 [Penicillium diatomitis]|uniref:Uncharacterized protein n=1 Tax=Penicillium diatomitis TaxID=2819901 RepID=A0A9W9X2V0_9EURO|nr:uncharacterized protein N7539_006144 [Penicillium diatomitis]KAJ5482698.1 hypothetical protein N7539_006144 [Penicillium diatomitis]